MFSHSPPKLSRRFTRPRASALLIPLLIVLGQCVATGAVLAEDVGVLLPNVAKSYVVTTDGKGGATVVPLAGVVRPGGSPTTPPVDPPPGPVLTPFAKEIQAQTANVLTKGGSKTTGAGLSEVYSRVGSAVADGTITPDKALGTIKTATDLVLAKQDDKDAWGPWRAAVGEALTKRQQEGALSEKAHYVAAFKEISAGLNAATGYSPQIGMAAMEGPGMGILDGFNIEKLLEIIKLIVELLKLFGGVK